MIPFYKPFFPPLKQYDKYLQGIWSRERLTNNGPLVIQLENQLEKYLGVKNVVFVSSGSIALNIAIKSLSLKGEIITTPFSFIATLSSILWNNCKPIFSDIERKTFCIDSFLIEEAITSKTSAILVTHIFGHPCNF